MVFSTIVYDPHEVLLGEDRKGAFFFPFIKSVFLINVET